MTSQPKHTLNVMKAREYGEMSSDELREALAKLKHQKMVNAAKNQPLCVKKLEHPSGEIRQTKKSIARIMTILVKRKEKCV